MSVPGDSFLRLVAMDDGVGDFAQQAMRFDSNGPGAGSIVRQEPFAVAEVVLLQKGPLRRRQTRQRLVEADPRLEALVRIGTEEVLGDLALSMTPRVTPRLI